MANPTKLARKRFKKIEKETPKKAELIKSRVSGEIYGLYPTSDGYTSSDTIEAVFEEGFYKYGLE